MSKILKFFRSLCCFPKKEYYRTLYFEYDDDLNEEDCPPIKLESINSEYIPETYINLQSFALAITYVLSSAFTE